MLTSQMNNKPGHELDFKYFGYLMLENLRHISSLRYVRFTSLYDCVWHKAFFKPVPEKHLVGES